MEKLHGKAAEYLIQVMSPDYAGINYCATTSASLMVANMDFPNANFTSKATTHAYEVVVKMDENHYIFGSRLVQDKLVKNLVRKSIANGISVPHRRVIQI